MKKLKIILIALGLLAGSFTVSAAATCTNVFPISLNGYVSGACIPSAWGNALEAKLGITGSAATSSLDYQINHIFTSYGSESITSSSVPWINYQTASSPSSTWLKTANNLSDIPSTSTARTNLGLGDASLLSSSTWFKVSNNLSEGTPSTERTNLGLGSIATFGSTDYLASTTKYIGSINGASSTGGLAYSIVAGNNITIATSSTSTVINVVTTNSAAGSDQQVQYNNGGSFGATSTFTFTSSTQQLSLSNVSSSEVIGAQFQRNTYLPYSSTTSSFTVPVGESSMTIFAYGSAGGNATNSAPSGYGGVVEGTYAVSGGQTYYYGFIPGGTGGASNLGTNDGAMGGYASWISPSSTFSTSSVLLVAPGGGGGGGNGIASSNGGGGGGGAGYGGGGGGGSAFNTVNPGNGGALNNGTGGNGGTDGTGGAAGGGYGGSTAVAGSAGTNGSASVNGNGGAGGGSSASSGGTGTASGLNQAGGGGGGAGNGTGVSSNAAGGSNGGGYGGGSSGVSPGSGGGGGGAGSAFIASSLTSTSSAYSNSASGTAGTYIVIASSTPNPSDGTLSVNGHIVFGTKALTVSSCGTGAGVVGSDNSGYIDIGSGTVTSCTLHFASPFSFTVNPTANLNVTGLSVGVNPSTSTVIFSTATTMAGDVLYYNIGANN